jgi:glutamate synthase domain-containing protein 2/glutamate synthase domain-containing protein 1/glutamate synthase domain-containing protein 3
MKDLRKDFENYGLYRSQFEHDSCGVGFVCNIKGIRSNSVVKQALHALKRLSHRGASGADPKTGDGAGILIQIPHSFFASVFKTTPEQGSYGTGLIFFPTSHQENQFCKDVFLKFAKQLSLDIIGYRQVPIHQEVIGKTARQTLPAIEQIFVTGKTNSIKLETSLYILRKLVENAVRNSSLKQKSFFYITNISSRTFLYKGLLMPEQLDEFFLDLKDERLCSSIALIHSRYSTNTFPTWDLAQPFRLLAHNGEINTLRGNINWMRAREGLLKTKKFGKNLKNLFPVIVPGGSDSAMLDNVFEFLVHSGRDLIHVISMLIPPAWEHNSLMKQSVKDFYRYYSCMMEPWDGPAAIAFTDGEKIGAILDRNGLRPARYIVTKDDVVVMSSEVGVLDIPPENILCSGRLEPGKIFFVDTEKGCIVQDEQIKKHLSTLGPYGKWLKQSLLELKTINSSFFETDQENIIQLLKAFGYTREDLRFVIKPMIENASEPIGSMGDDTPLAVFSKNPRLLFDYFKQLFAQVTNPPIDPIREEIVMSIHSLIGCEKNLLEETPLHCHRLKIDTPVLTDEEIQKIKNINQSGFKTKTISILFKKGKLQKRLGDICKQTRDAIRDGFTFVILSDRGVDKNNYAIPSLLAVSCVHQYLVKQGLRTQIGIILQTAEPREVHHFAVLFGFGADCVNPYGAFQAIKYLIKQDNLRIKLKSALHNYIMAVEGGIKKIISKMGISTLHSYKGAQIFEALGISEDVIDKYFTGTVSRIGGIDLNVIEQETIIRHREGFPNWGFPNPYLSTGGVYQYKKDGEFHLWNPESISALQIAVRENNWEKYLEFSNLINDQSKNPTTIRGTFRFKQTTPIPIEDVEPVSSILKRFATGAMSFGSISGSAHQAIAIAMNRIRGKSNTGEGGENPARFVPFPNEDCARSAIKQVASGRFGVTINYLVNADEIQIKIAQGAKPGEGGQLPGHKVSVEIAKIRYTTPGVTLISPPPHHDIYSIEDLAQLIFDLKNANPDARISVKLVSEIGIGTVAAGVAKGYSDMILISGGDGGTGASPLSSIRNAGLPWELGLSETHQTLVLNELRSRVRLQTDGQMRTGRDVAIACLLGAEEFGFSTSVLIVIGCVMLRHCHLNNCSLGVATQDAMLEKRFKGKPEYIINYFNFVAKELQCIMAQLGIRKIDDMVGRTELLELNKRILPWKAKMVNVSRILYKPNVYSCLHCTIKQEHKIKDILDLKIIEAVQNRATEHLMPIRAEFNIQNTDRTTGAMLSSTICKKYGEEGLLEDTIHIKFKGIAGQSFGAFLAKGITFELEGLANDYVGKGISGGKIIIYPHSSSDYSSEENIIIGNTAFYGAISGETYIRGIAGERFCVRNSGLYAVVEGVGDHGCEYMTGGRVVIVGRTGRNFAAGMSGGIAYVFNVDGMFKKRCNKEMVVLEELTEEDIILIRNLIQKHYKSTNSNIAKKILNDFQSNLKLFIKVIPIEYKKILESKTVEEGLKLTEVSDG